MGIRKPTVADHRRGGVVLTSFIGAETMNPRAVWTQEQPPLVDGPTDSTTPAGGGVLDWVRQHATVAGVVAVVIVALILMGNDTEGDL